MAIEVTPWDTAEMLRDTVDIGYFLEAAMEDSDSAYVAHALTTCARARGGVDVLARESGVSESELQSAIDRKDESAFTVAHAIRNAFCADSMHMRVA